MKGQEELRQEQQKQKQLDEAENLYKAIFAGPRDPRSDEYKGGVMAALLYRFAGIKVSESRPYQVGTVEFDAFSAGVTIESG